MSDTGVSTQDVTVETPDGPIRLYEAKPPGEARGALVVIQEAFGVNPHIEDVTRRAAAAGYHAVAPDFFHRSGPGAVVEYGNFELVMEYFQALGSDDAILNDVDAALNHLRAAGFNDSQIGAVGFCFGGRVSFLVALRRALGASVSFYGGGIVNGRFPQFPALVGEVATLQTPWLGLFGDQDGSIPVEDVEALRSALRGVKIDTDIVRYPEAGHGFHCDQRPDYRPDDAADAWRRALDWFSSHLK
jgi:carboxymethylenebutenolidase